MSHSPMNRKENAFQAAQNEINENLSEISRNKGVDVISNKQVNPADKSSAANEPRINYHKSHVYQQQ